jgi:polysaccharide export outer membrane protein
MHRGRKETMIFQGRFTNCARIFATAGTVALIAFGVTLHAQSQLPAQPTGAQTSGAATTTAQPNRTVASPAAPAAVPTPPDYVIGPQDVLSIVYWREKDISADVTVRPDGMISLPLLNDVKAAGLTPTQLHDRLIEESRRYVEDPNITVVVSEINSRKAFITGEIANPGEYPLSGPTTVIQLIAKAGGLRDYANSKKIVIVRTENGRVVTYPFNYKDVVNRKSLKLNIELKPGDTVIVP